MEKDVLPWLKIAEELRSLSLESELSVPQICVMGDQSSGKSSVLNLLAGDLIFPSGSGLVTRCPIRLVMRKARAGEDWCAFVSTSISSKRIEAPDIESLYQLIALATTSLCQGTSNFSTEVVIVDLLSPDACDLTVVDLPGIVRTATTGEELAYCGAALLSSPSPSTYYSHWPMRFEHSIHTRSKGQCHRGCQLSDNDVSERQTDYHSRSHTRESGIVPSRPIATAQNA